MTSAEHIIELLNLRPLETEGGFYLETYRSEERVPAETLPARYRGPRPFSTAIYYLVTADRPSRLHRLVSDEIYHFYLGDPVRMLQLHPNGRSRELTLGPDLEGGQLVQTVVPRGVWQGLLVPEGGSWGLLGTTVTPGFEFVDFELADRAHLLAAYPRHRDIILRLT